MTAPFTAVPPPAPVEEPKPAAEEQEWFEKRALELGADELMARATWVLRDDPQAVLRLSRRYVTFCMDCLREMNQVAKLRIRTRADKRREAILVELSRAGGEGVMLQRLCEAASASIEETISCIRQINASDAFIHLDACIDLRFDGDSGVVWVVL